MGRKNVRRAITAVIALAIVGSSGLALAQATSTTTTARTPAETVQYRQQQLRALGGATKAVMDQVRGGSPDLAVIRTNAATIQQLATAFPTWFPAGSGAEAGVQTKAKAEIWSNGPEFAARVQQLQTAAAGLTTASAGTDVAAASQAAMGVGAACGACHREFRAQQ